MSSFRDLRVWRDAVKLTAEVYKATAQFPKHEQYGLTPKTRRAAGSIPSNIAEGKGHYSNKEFSRFLYHARGSLLELETQLVITKQLQYVSEWEEHRLATMAGSVGRALAGLINSLGPATS